VINIDKIRVVAGETFGVPILKGQLILNPIDLMKPLERLDNKKSVIEFIFWLELNRQLYFQEMPLQFLEKEDEGFELLIDEVKRSTEKLVIELADPKPWKASESYEYLLTRINLLVLEKEITQKDFDNFDVKEVGKNVFST
jgi:hypothetical protein